MIGTSPAHLAEMLLRLLQFRSDQLRHVRRRRRQGRHCRRSCRDGRELVVPHDGSRFSRRPCGCLGPADVVPVVGRAGEQSTPLVRWLDLHT